MTDWSLKTAQDAVTRLVTDILTADEYKENRALVEEHDHWQDGDQWIGPKGDGAASTRQRILDRVKPQFTPTDAIAEAVGRWVDALVKTEADVRFEARVMTAKDADGKPAMTEQQQERAAEIRALLNAWWDRVKLWESVRTAARFARWSGRGVLRVRIPDGLLGDPKQGDESGRPTIPTGLTPDQALARVALAAEESNAAGVTTDPNTLRDSAVFLFNDADNKERAHVWELDDKGTLTLRDIGSSDETPALFPKATRLPIVEMRTQLLVNETVRRQNRRLNFLETLITRNGETASFPERYGLNAGPQGYWSTTLPPDVKPLKQEDVGGTTFYLLETPLTLGASTFTNLRGFEYDIDDTHKGITSPSVVRFDPVAPNFAIEPAAHSYAMLMKNCHQGHVVAQEVAQRSGIFVEQARADFDADVEKGNGPVVGVVAGILEAAMSLGATMSDELAAMLLEYRPVVTLHVDTGPRSVLERTQDAADVAAGLISDETAMLRGGVEDVAAERARIAASPAGAHAEARRQWELAAVIGQQGFDLVTAAVLAGVPEEKITEAFKLSQRLNAPPAPSSNGTSPRIPALTQ